MFARLSNRIKRSIALAHPLARLQANVLEVRDLSALMKAMHWSESPTIEGEHLFQFEYLEDLNDRRIRDAEVVCASCKNLKPAIALEIGTGYGYTTALMAANAPEAVIYTVNIPPEEIHQGGTMTSFAPAREEIGRYHRERGHRNIRQLFVNTANWEPDFGPIDVAFIDGCHDAEFVYHDTCKILRQCRRGSLILWHDFAPALVKVFAAADAVCQGIDMLYANQVITGPTLHLRDSFVGLYRVP